MLKTPHRTRQSADRSQILSHCQCCVLFDVETCCCTGELGHIARHTAKCGLRMTCSLPHIPEGCLVSLQLTKASRLPVNIKFRCVQLAGMQEGMAADSMQSPFVDLVAHRINPGLRDHCKTWRAGLQPAPAEACPAGPSTGRILGCEDPSRVCSVVHASAALT